MARQITGLGESYRKGLQEGNSSRSQTFGHVAGFGYETDGSIRSLRRNEITLFRTALAVAIVAATRLATMPLDFAPAVGLNDKILHVGAFLVLASLLDFAFPRTPFGAAKTATLLAYGIMIEMVQHYLPYRMFSLLDWAADAAGVVGYLVIAVPILKRTPWFQRRWDPQVSQ